MVRRDSVLYNGVYYADLAQHTSTDDKLKSGSGTGSGHEGISLE